MFNNRSNNLTATNTLYLITDDALKKTYEDNRHKYKTNLLGLEKGCNKKFKIVTVTGPVFESDKVNTTDILQSDLENCVLLAFLRAIARRYPHVIPTMLKETEDNHFEITLFSDQPPYFVNNYKQTTYKFEKTTVVPIPASGYLQSVSNFFARVPKKISKPWVKLIEKALVLHLMNTDYHHHLMELQNYGESYSPFTLTTTIPQPLIPSYHHVVQIIGNAGIVSELLFGIKSENTLVADFHYDPNNPNIAKIEKAKKDIMENFLKGELITLEVVPNKLGFETGHEYEIVNFAMDEKTNEEYVLLGNPWGYNSKKSLSNHTKVNILSLNLLVKYSNEELAKDQSIIILPVKTFYKLIKRYQTTCGIAKALNLLPTIMEQDLSDKKALSGVCI